jgi:hypothetical protein
MNHEFQTHRIDTQWRCNLCAKNFSTALLLRVHIDNTHKKDFELSQIEEVIAGSERLAIRQGVSELCPFCQTVPSETQKGFASHVGRHLQEISLAALPALDSYSDGESSDDGNDGNDGNDDYDDTGEAPEQQSPPQSPLSLDSLSMADIDPTNAPSSSSSALVKRALDKDKATPSESGLDGKKEFKVKKVSATSV